MGKFPIILLALIFLAACAPSPTLSDPMTAAQVTIVVGATQTAQAVRATSEAGYIAATGTAAAATSTGVAAASTAEAAVATATHASAMATATEDARLSQADQALVDIAVTVAQDNAAAAALLNQQVIQDNANRLAAEAVKRERSNLLAFIRGVVLIILLALSGFAILLLIGVMVFDRLDMAKQRRRALAILAGVAPAPSGSDKGNKLISVTAPAAALPPGQPGRLTTGQTPLAALPSNARSQVLRSQAVALRDYQADWGKWEGYRGEKVIVGVGLDGPISFDPAVNPHMLWTGSSRRGKSTNAVVYLTSLIRLGYYVVILNERASDFAPLTGRPNVTNLRAFSDNQRLDLALEAMKAAVAEMERRDLILQFKGLNNWASLLQAEPEAPPLFFLIDEAIELCQSGGQAYQDDLLNLIYKIASQAGKFSIGIGLCATDPTSRQLGSVGYGVIQQCGRVVFGFNSDSPSRSVLGDTSAVGLPPGQFIAVRGDGDRVAGVGFRADPPKLTGYLDRLAVPSVIPPATVARLTGPGAYLKTVENEALQEKDPALARLMSDSNLIGRYSGSNLTSRTAIAERLRSDGYQGWGSTGENVKRVELALEYRARVMGDEWARQIIEDKSTTALAAEDRARIEALAPAP